MASGKEEKEVIWNASEHVKPGQRKTRRRSERAATAAGKKNWEEKNEVTGREGSRERPRKQTALGFAPVWRHDKVSLEFQLSVKQSTVLGSTGGPGSNLAGDIRSSRSSFDLSVEKSVVHGSVGGPGSRTRGFSAWTPLKKNKATRLRSCSLATRTHRDQDSSAQGALASTNIGQPEFPRVLRRAQRRTREHREPAL